MKIAWVVSTTVCCSGLKTGPWPISDVGLKPFLGFPVADVYGTNIVPNATSLWGCASNETLVLYTVWTDPKSKLSLKSIRLPAPRPSMRVRCCPNPGAEEHLIPGEVCPLGRDETEDTLVLPQNLSWAPASAPCALTEFPIPKCCSKDSQAHCQFLHDRTPEGKICLFGRPVCCQRASADVSLKITTKGVCLNTMLVNTGSAGIISDDGQVLLTGRFERFRKWIKDVSNSKKLVLPKNPVDLPPQNQTYV